MPNFHVHWLVALQAIGSAPPEVQSGFKTYVAAGLDLRDRFLAVLEGVRTDGDVERARTKIGALRKKWSDDLLNADPTALDEMTCFSAYTLGACGPDFWTLASDSGGLIPDFASEHFDLGHYNRTHAQFQVSAAAIGGRTDASALAEQAYFAGMATHFAADLAIHQLVNVSAGAYNLLRKHWHNEQPHGKPFWTNLWDELVVKGLVKAFFPSAPAPSLRPFLEDNLGNQIGIWSTHNKVEHYWDTYVRHRYLGDVPVVFPGTDESNWNGFQPLGLPTAEGLWRSVRASRSDAPESVGRLLREPWVKWAIEKPLMLPWLFCERVLRQQLRPFIFDRVVHESGAYPPALMPEKVKKEKRHPQMADSKADAEAGVNRSEKKKLAFFSSALNDADSRPISFNYLTHYVCPDFDKLVKQEDRDADREHLPGANAFYDLPAVGQFVDAGAKIAGRFLAGLRSAYGGGRSRAPSSEPPPVPHIGDLEGFWNLDTGVGVRVEDVATDSAAEVSTRIDLHHVFELLPERLRYARQVPWLARIADRKKQFAFPAKKAFKFRESQERYQALGAIHEPDQEAYLQSILLTEQARAAQKKPPGVKPDAYWTVAAGPQAFGVETPTETVCDAGETRVSVLDLAHRLTLTLRIGVADLGGEVPEKLAMFAVSDTQRGVGPLGDEAMAWTHDQYEDHDGVILDHSETPEATRNGVQYFATRVLLGFETDPDLERIVELGTWNNAVGRNDVGRNISIATGRRLVLRPTPPSVPLPFTHKRGGVQFRPLDDFAYCEEASPTEQLFFTFYPLVRTAGGVFDVFGKQKVEERQLEELMKVDVVGFVKIVLLYDLGPYGALQVGRCYVDGMPVPVRQVKA